MGHFRYSVTGAYVGTFSMAERVNARRIKGWVQLTEENPRFVRAMHNAGMARAWLGGRFAAGLNVESNDKMRLFIATRDLMLLDGNVLFLLKQELMDILQRGVDLTDHQQTADPDDVFELQLIRAPGPSHGATAQRQ